MRGCRFCNKSLRCPGAAFTRCWPARARGSSAEGAGAPLRSADAMPITPGDLRFLDHGAPWPLLVWSAHIFTRNGFVSARELHGVAIADIVGLQNAPRADCREQVVRLLARANSSQGRGARWGTSGERPVPTSFPIPPCAGAARCVPDSVDGGAPAARSRSPVLRATDGVGRASGSVDVLFVRAQGLAGAAGHGQVAGPRAAVGTLRAQLKTNAERSAWVRAAWAEAVLGSCPSSHASAKSGLRCWFAFAKEVLGVAHEKALPPSAEGLVAWSLTFRCHGTYCNYVSHVRLGCLLADVDTAVFDHPAIRRAKAAVDKRVPHASRQRHFIRLCLLERLIALPEAREDGGAPWRYLWLFAYVFLLRVPSEALPAHAGDEGPAPSWQSGLFVRGEELCLRLRRRKNRRHGRFLTRGCWCRQSPTTCPVHVIGRWLATRQRGEPLFPGVTPALALRTLRRHLGALAVPDWGEYRTHDFRRGHAEASARWPCGSRPRSACVPGPGLEAIWLLAGCNLARGRVEVCAPLRFACVGCPAAQVSGLLGAFGSACARARRRGLGPCCRIVGRGRLAWLIGRCAAAHR